MHHKAVWISKKIPWIAVFLIVDSLSRQFAVGRSSGIRKVLKPVILIMKMWCWPEMSHILHEFELSSSHLLLSLHFHVQVEATNRVTILI